MLLQPFANCWGLENVDLSWGIRISVSSVVQPTYAYCVDRIKRNLAEGEVKILTQLLPQTAKRTSEDVSRGVKVLLLVCRRTQ